MTAARPERADHDLIRPGKQRWQTWAGLTDTKDPDVLGRVDESHLQASDTGANDLRGDARNHGDGLVVLTRETADERAKVLRVETEFQNTRGDLSRQFMAQFAREDGSA